MDPELQAYLAGLVAQAPRGLSPEQVRQRIEIVRQEIERQAVVIRNRGLDQPMRKAIDWHHRQRLSAFQSPGTYVPTANDDARLGRAPAADRQYSPIPQVAAERLIEGMSFHPAVAGAVAVSEGREVLPPELANVSGPVALLGFFSRGVFHGLRESGAEAARSERLATELDRLLRQPNALRGNEFVLGIAWSGIGDPVVGLFETYQRLQNLEPADVAAVAGAIVRTLATLLNESNKVIAFEAGQWLAERQAHQVIETLTSEPPSWWSDPPFLTSVLRELTAQFNWRSFELGRFVGPLIWAVLDVVLSVAGVPEMLAGSARLIRNLVGLVRRALPDNDILLAGRAARRLGHRPDAGPGRRVPHAVDLPGRAARPHAPPLAVHPRGTGGPDVTSAGSPVQRGTATAVAQADAQPIQPARSRPVSRTAPATRTAATDHPTSTADRVAGGRQNLPSTGAQDQPSQSRTSGLRDRHRRNLVRPLNRNLFRTRLRRRRRQSPPNRSRMTSRFREWAIDRISGTQGHLLEFLLDDSKGDFLSAPRRRHSDLADSLAVEMGHRISRHTGAPEGIAIQDAWTNQIDNIVIERLGGWVDNPTIEIGGVPVDLRSAWLWESWGLLPEGTCATAPRALGWTDR